MREKGYFPIKNGVFKMGIEFFIVCMFIGPTNTKLLDESNL